MTLSQEAPMPELTKAGKEELALALLLWRDFKSDGKLDIEITKQTLGFVRMLGVEEEFNALLPQVPPMRIMPR
jgi:hypothetical protein